MDIQQTVAALDGSPDNGAAQKTLALLEEAGAFFRYDCDGTLDSYCRLGVLTIDGRRSWVQREVDDWQNIKIWQIKIVPIN